MSGWVVAEGKPLADAEVFLYYERGERDLHDRLAGRTRTDPRGNFNFEQALVWEPETEARAERVNRYDVVAYQPGHGLGVQTLAPGDRLTSVGLTLDPLEEHSVHATDPEGHDLEGVRVTWFADQQRLTMPFARQVSDESQRAESG